MSLAVSRNTTRGDGELPRAECTSHFDECKVQNSFLTPVLSFSLHPERFPCEQGTTLLRERRSSAQPMQLAYLWNRLNRPAWRVLLGIPGNLDDLLRALSDGQSASIAGLWQSIVVQTGELLAAVVEVAFCPSSDAVTPQHGKYARVGSDAKARGCSTSLPAGEG